MVKQISVFLENKKGRLADVTEALGRKGVNIRALSIADTADYGILRLIVNDPDLAYRVLSEAEFTVSIREVLAIGIEDRPGSLASALRVLEENGIVVEYMYAFYGKAGDKPLVILKLSDSEGGVRVLKEAGILVIDSAKIYSL